MQSIGQLLKKLLSGWRKTMADLSIFPSQLSGHIAIPSSKSHTLRAILFAALAHGRSQIDSFLSSPDTNAMIDAVRLLGASVEMGTHRLAIEGVKGKPQAAKDVIQCGNSGQALRFISALGGLIPAFTVLTGDLSLRERRPMQPLLGAMQQLGAFAVSSRGDGYAPILVRGPFTEKKAMLEGQDSQPVSGLLIAAAFAQHPIELHVAHPGEKPWIALTLDWFDRLQIPYFAKDYTHYALKGSAQIEGFQYCVPGDWSTAAFPIAAALITQSELTLHNIDRYDIQGDKAILPILERMGAQFVFDPLGRSLTVKREAKLKGIKIDINDCIDALPIFAVLGCFAEGTTEIFNGQIARKKESDRIFCIAQELKKMGANIEEAFDGLKIYTSQLHGKTLEPYADHRIALSLAVAALGAQSPSTLRNTECIAKTYGSFYNDFRKIGATLTYPNIG
jgi:3-phosphoshikimate 1-carboxyvinyltransferase